MPTPEAPVKTVDGQTDAEDELSPAMVEQMTAEIVDEFDCASIEAADEQLRNEEEEQRSTPPPAAPSQGLPPRVLASFLAATLGVAFLVAFLSADVRVLGLPAAVWSMFLTMSLAAVVFIVAGPYFRGTAAASAGHDGDAMRRSDDGDGGGSRVGTISQRECAEVLDSVFPDTPIEGRAASPTTLEKLEKDLHDATLREVEKIRIFFESLLEKHVFRINQDLRAKESELDRLRREKSAPTAAPATRDDGDDPGARLERERARMQREFDELRRKYETEKQQWDKWARIEKGHREEWENQIAELQQRIVELESELASAKHNAGALEWKPVNSVVCVRDLVKDTADAFRSRARKRNIKITVRVPKGLREVCCDERLVFGVLREVLGKTVAFTAKGGQIDVSASLYRQERKGAPVVLILKVKNTGRVFSQKDRKQIFGEASHDVFGRLVLDLAREYLRRLGGDLVLQSGTVQGNLFIVTVPVGGNQGR